jgi:DNA-binding LacI/PurR family transcriptional regulator
LGVAHQFGRKIPQDLAIVGFDNIPESEFLLPSLTTLYQQLIDVGCLAVQQLHQQIEARRRDDSAALEAIVLTPELLMRDSSASR